MADAVVDCSTGLLTGGATGTVQRGLTIVPSVTGQGGGVRWCDVKTLSANPAAVTDWGPLILTARDNGARTFFFADMEYPFTTALDFSGNSLVTLQGENGKAWPGDFSATVLVRSRLLWKGAGSGRAITAGGALSTGFTIDNLGVYYDNPLFTGTLVAPGYVANMGRECLIRDSTLRSTPASGLLTARTIVSFDEVIVSTIDNSVLGYAQYCVTGVENNFSNANRIINSVLDSPSVFAIGNTGDQWTIDSNTFELGSTGGAIGCIGTHGGGSFSVTNNWLGDTTNLTFDQASNATWNATFSGNSIYRSAPGGIIWHLAGGGVINIIDNPNIQNSSAAVVDLVAGSPAKELTYRGNDGQCTTEAILNRAGHRLHLDGNAGSGIVGVTEIEQERFVYPANRPALTATPLAALGTGGTVTIYGGDSGGQAVLNVGSGASAGALVTFTFGSPFTYAPGSPSAGPIVHLTPYITPSAVDAGLYISARSATGWTLAARNVPAAGGLYFFYRVAGM